MSNYKSKKQILDIYQDLGSSMFDKIVRVNKEVMEQHRRNMSSEAKPKYEYDLDYLDVFFGGDDSCFCMNGVKPINCCYCPNLLDDEWCLQDDGTRVTCFYAEDPGSSYDAADEENFLDENNNVSKLFFVEEEEIK